MALIFVGVIAVLAVIFYFDDFQKIIGGDEVVTSSELEGRLAEVKSKVEAMDGYNSKDFKDLVANIDVWKNKTYIDEEGRATLRLTLFEGMLKKIEADYNNTLANYNIKPADAHKRLNNDVAGLNEVAKVMDKALDNDAKEIKTIHQLYTNVYNFVNSGHKPKAEFKVDEGKTWKSFDEHKNGFVATAAGYRNNQLYSKLNHISKFNEGLSENNVRKNVDNYRDSFYEDLAKQIIDYFGSIDENQLESYKYVVNAFDRETDDNSTAYKTLMSAYKNYRKEYSNQ